MTTMDQPAAIRVKNRRLLPDVVDYQLQLNVKNSLMKVQSSGANGKTYISVFNDESKSKNSAKKRLKIDQK